MSTRMTSRWPAAVAVGLSLAALVVVGCTGKTPPKASVPGGGASGAGTPTSVKPLADWPEDLAGVLVISGEMAGYMEPCGCTDGQLGGLIRRMTFADMVRTERKWPLAMIDLGGLINDPHDTKHGGGPQQTNIKFASALKALTMLKYSAIAMSVDDLKLGTAEALMGYVNSLPQTADAPKIVAANVTPASGAGFETCIRPSVKTEVGPIKVGVTAVLDQAAFDALKDVGKSDLMTVVDPETALGPVLTDLEKDTDLQVLLVQGPPALAQKLGLAFPGFDVVVATTLHSEPETQPKTLNGGETWLVTVGRKGQYVGAIGLPKDKSKKRLYQRIELNSRYDPFKSRGEPMRKLIDEDFVGELKAVGVLQGYLKQPYILTDGSASKATYVGAETCKGCHPNTFAKWESTKHAHAYEALTSNPKRNREADADCVRCHTTGFEYDSGFTTAELTPKLKGNQCENCHGPGSEHSAAPDDKTARANIARSSEYFKSNRTCINCHDEDNAPHGFDFDKMWEQIKHKHMDNYGDPKVHRGVALKK